MGKRSARKSRRLTSSFCKQYSSLQREKYARDEDEGIFNEWLCGIPEIKQCVYITIPPSTWSVWPVMYAAAGSMARNFTKPEISSG